MYRVTLCLILIACQLRAAQIPVSWAEFRTQIAARHLHGSQVEITSSDGRRTKAKLIDVEENSIRIKPQKAWPNGQVPASQVAAVKFKKKNTRNGLLGMAAGAGAGAGIGLAATRNVDVYEGPAVAIVPGVIGATAIGLAVAGWFIGRSIDAAGPEFTIIASRPAPPCL